MLSDLVVQSNCGLRQPSLQTNQVRVAATPTSKMPRKMAAVEVRSSMHTPPDSVATVVAQVALVTVAAPVAVAAVVA